MPEFAKTDWFDLKICRPEPDKQTSPIPVIVVSGFACDDMPLVLDVLVKLGRIAVCPQIKLREDGPKILGRFIDVDAIKRYSIFSTALMVKASPSFDCEQADVLAISKGAIDAVCALMSYPELVRNWVFVAPGGIHPGRNFIQAGWNLYKGLGRDSRDKKQLYSDGDEQTRKLLEMAGKVSHDYRTKYPAEAYLFESWTSATENIDRKFNRFRDRGAKIAIVEMTKDAWFRRDYLNLERMREGVDLITSIEGHHGDIRYIRSTCEQAVDVLRQLGIARTLLAKDIYGPILPHGDPLKMLQRVTIYPDKAVGEMRIEKRHCQGVFGGDTLMSVGLGLEVASHVLGVKAAEANGFPAGVVPFLGGISDAEFSMKRPKVGDILRAEVRIARQGKNYVNGSYETYVGTRLVDKVGSLFGAFGSKM